MCAPEKLMNSKLKASRVSCTLICMYLYIVRLRLSLYLSLSLSLCTREPNQLRAQCASCVSYYTDIYSTMHMCSCVRVCIYMCVCVYIYIYIYIYMYVCIHCMCVCMYIECSRKKPHALSGTANPCTHTYIHTYIPTYRMRKEEATCS